MCATILRAPTGNIRAMPDLCGVCGVRHDASAASIISRRSSHEDRAAPSARLNDEAVRGLVGPAPVSHICGCAGKRDAGRTAYTTRPGGALSCALHTL